MKKTMLVLTMSSLLLAGCGIEDKNKDVLYQVDDLADEKTRENLTDERIAELLKAQYPKEELNEAISIELSTYTDGSEVFSVSEDETNTYFRTFKRDGENIVKTWEKVTESIEGTQFYIDSIFPDVRNNKNIIVVGVNTNPGMYLNYFVVGQLEEKEEMEILYDNIFENNEAVYQGEIVVSDERIMIAEDGINSYALVIEGNQIVKKKTSF